MENEFDLMIKKSYTFNQKEYERSPEWKMLKELYILNYMHNYNRTVNTEFTIPKKIHQIWLGGPLPDKYLEFTKSWKKFHPNWEYHLWTGKDVDGLLSLGRNSYDVATNYGMKSDILRYEILYKYGGIYVDTDFECMKAFDGLLNLRFFTGVGYDTIMQLYIGLIACVPGHPIIFNCLQNMKTKYTGTKGSVICNETGANYFTRMFVDNIKNHNGYGVVAFPTDFFYPYPNNIRGEGNPYEYATENTYAIHHWAVSWSNKGRK
jgi:inositol phosphorylceramide mannosyltransferase catalytic subunit